MTKLNLKDFERRIRVRLLGVEDYDAAVELQRRCFPGMKPWLPEQFASQIHTFPEGQIGVEYQGRLVASSSSLIVDFSQYSEWHNWKNIADNGFIRNHDAAGDTLYGIEIMVDPKYRGLKLARRLYEERKRLARERNLARIIIGGRIPGYGKHAKKLSAREYVEKVMDKTLVDPVLTAQLANGFVLKQLIPDYFPSDSESLGYATHLEWPNLDHVFQAKQVPRAASTARICVVQYELRRVATFGDFARQCDYFTEIASDYKSDFILFPELLTAQLLSLVRAPRPGLAARKIAEFTKRYLELFTGLAIRYNVNIIGGSHFTHEGDKLHNVSYLFRRDGTLAKQYKMHITPNERRWWGVLPGNALDVFDTDRGKIAILIDYDVEFPELARIAADKGAQILFVPFDTDSRYGYMRVKSCAQARCVENHVYAAIAGCVGTLPLVENADIHYAQSGIYTPSDVQFSRDMVAAECTANVETVIVHEVDLDLIRLHRETGTVQNWNDRRTDFYSLRYTEGDKERTVGVREG
jgi:predicted amidohydrolase/ribosomal protein S18 acetylase RimI-like enzyme